MLLFRCQRSHFRLSTILTSTTCNSFGRFGESGSIAPHPVKKFVKSTFEYFRVLMHLELSVKVWMKLSLPKLRLKFNFSWVELL